MICSPRSFQGLSAGSRLPTAALPHTHSLSTSACSFPNATPWVTLSYLCTCSCPHLVPDFLPFLLAYLLHFLKIYPIALHTSRGHHSDYSVNDARWSCAALYNKMPPQGLLPPKRTFFCFSPDSIGMTRSLSRSVKYRKAFPSPSTVGSLRVWRIRPLT